MFCVIINYKKTHFYVQKIACFTHKTYLLKINANFNALRTNYHYKSGQKHDTFCLFHNFKLTANAFPAAVAVARASAMCSITGPIAVTFQCIFVSVMSVITC